MKARPVKPKREEQLPAETVQRRFWLRALRATCLAAVVMGLLAPWANSTAAASGSQVSVGQDSSCASRIQFNVTATPGNGQVSLSWSEVQIPDLFVSYYNVEDGTSPGGESGTPVTNITTTSTTVPGLTNGVTYYFVIDAIFEQGATASSPQQGTPLPSPQQGTTFRSCEVSATPTAPPASSPGAPTGLTATAGDSQVSLSWTAPGSDGGSQVTSYNVYDGTSAGGESQTPVTTVTGTSATVNGLTNGNTYYFVVTAVNAVGEGSSSNEAQAAPAAVPPPSTPQTSPPQTSQPGPSQSSAGPPPPGPPNPPGSSVLVPIILLGAGVMVSAVMLAARRRRARSRQPSPPEPSVLVEQHVGPPGQVSIRPTGSRATVTVRIEPHPGTGTTMIEEARP
jgi:hypothetical protein